MKKKTEQYCPKKEQQYKKTKQWYKTRNNTDPFLFCCSLWKKGTVVKEKRNNATKTVIQTHAVPKTHTEEKRNSSAKNGTAVHGTVVQNTLLHFCSDVEKMEQ